MNEKLHECPDTKCGFKGNSITEVKTHLRDDHKNFLMEFLRDGYIKAYREEKKNGMRK